MSVAATAQIKALKSGLRRLRRGIQPAVDELRKLSITKNVQSEEEAQELAVEFESRIAEVTQAKAEYLTTLTSLELNIEIAGEDPQQDVDELGDFSNEIAQVLARANTVVKLVVNPLITSPLRKNQLAEQASPRDTLQFENQLSRVLELMEARAQGGQGPEPAVKLPAIPLPNFNGDLLKWKPFWDRFEAAVHTNSRLSQVDKLNYLFGQLSGDALKLIETLPLINENYDVAINQLKQKYGKPKTMVAALYRKFNELKETSNEPTKLRFFCTEVECIMGSLGALGQKIEDDHFVSMILSKLPDDLMMTLEHTKNVEDEWSVMSLRKALADHLEKMDSVARSSYQRQKPDKNGTVEAKWDYEIDGSSTGEALYANSMSSSRGRTVQWNKNKTVTEKSNWLCAFCKGNHYEDNCQKYPTVESRQQVVYGRCFNCLREGHKVKECTSVKPCFHCKKLKNHHSSLCYKKFGRRQGHENVNLTNEVDGDSHLGDSNELDNQTSVVAAPAGEGALLATGEMVVLQTAKSTVVNTLNHQVTANPTILFDIGSNRSYLTESMAKSLKLKIRKGPELLINRFATDKVMKISSKLAELCMCLDDGTLFQLTVTIVPTITGSLSKSPIKLEEVQRLAAKLKLADDFPHRREKREIELLIGNDYYADIVTGERLQVAEGLYFIGSKIGWILTGRMPKTPDNQESVTMCCFTSFAGSLDPLTPQLDSTTMVRKPQMDDLWSLDSIGIRDNPDDSDDDIAMKNFKSTIKLEDSRYMVTFPWRDSNIDLPTNYNLSLRRLESTVKKLKSKPDLLAKYAEIIEDQKKKGIIELVDEQTILGTRFHYIPHHAVITPTKTTTKVRIVYDGSARADRWSRSLNECLHRGPVLLEDLCGLLMRFRLSKIALTSDIEKAFLQVGLDNADRDVTRFLWLRDPSNPELRDNLVTYRFCRVPFGVNSSPFLLEATVQHHLQRYDSKVPKLIARNTYVDNVITGVDNDENALTFYEQSKKIFQDASMNLREWCSNSSLFMSTIPEKDRVKPGLQKVLGISWDTLSDTLQVNVNKDKLGDVQTKRDLLSAVAGVFDPLGFMLPITIRGKILLQSVCTKNLAWDDDLGLSDKKAWVDLVPEYLKIANVSIPRFIGPSESSKVELLCFCDASQRSYATTIYLRIAGKTTTSHLIFAKSRLSPLKKITVPRLELLALWAGSNAVKFTRKHLHLNIENVTLWSDSQVVLGWLKSQKCHGRFVENRIKKIRQTQNAVFRYLSTTDNPADLATRGITTSEINSLWWHGPEWIKTPRENWPSWNIPEIDSEILARNAGANLHEMSVVVSADETVIPPMNIEICNHSSLTRLIRVTAWCVRFTRNARRIGHYSSSRLSADELEYSRLIWVKFVQKSHYSEVYSAIQLRKRHKLDKLGLQVDDKGLLRCHGRLANADLPDIAKYPILLPGQDAFTKLLIALVHERSGHPGVSHTLNLVRQKYWVTKGRSVVRNILIKCTLCRRIHSRHYPLPKMPELPRSRVTPHPPFEYTGLDYFGPLVVKAGDCCKKVWVCLYTCLSVRAVHLELVGDMTADEFLGSLRRFIARRGKPSYILSDNAPQFKVVQSLMNRVWDDVCQSEEIYNYCSHQSIRWSYIAELAPWQGGVYERMVGVVKGSLRKALGKAKLSNSQLSTVLCEVEALVNSRPLTYVGDDFESSHIITPAHFLMLNPRMGIPNVDIDEANTDPDYQPVITTTTEVIKMWKKGLHILEEFWKTWQTDYLNGIREKTVYNHPKTLNCQFSPSVGHVVLIKDPMMPRGSWKMGRIVQLNNSAADNAVRSVYVRLANKRVICRPINLLYPLEFPKYGTGTPTDPETEIDTNGNISPPTVPSLPNIPSPRPQRKAAIEALEKCRQMLSPNNWII